MSRVAVVLADSASDLHAGSGTSAGVTVVPLLVTFGDKEYRAGVDLSGDDFWAELTAPGAPFPKTAAAAPGTFKETFERLFNEGADEIVYVGVEARSCRPRWGAPRSRARCCPTRRSTSSTRTRPAWALVCSRSSRQRRLPSGMSGEQVVAAVQRQARSGRPVTLFSRRWST